MRVKHYAQGKFYTIEYPKGTRVARAGERAEGEMAESDHLVVPFKGRELRLPADPPELLPLLAESGNFGIALVGGPVPEERLAGVACPGCGQDDVDWLQLGEGSEVVYCDRCGADFGLPATNAFRITSSDDTILKPNVKMNDG